MNLRIIPAYELSFAEQAAVFTRAFEGYVAGSVAMDAHSLARFLGSQAIDVWASRFLCLDSAPVGCAYVNRTGGIARISAMGLAPEARGRGAGRRFMDSLLAEARGRGETCVTLEVFEQNTPALRLYRSAGFQEVGRLYGWRRAPGLPPPGGPAAGLTEIPMLQAASVRAALEYPDIPWQLSRHAVAKIPPGARAFMSAHGALAVVNVGTDPARVLALEPGNRDERGWSELREVLRVLISRFSHFEWAAAAIFPDPYGKELFEPLGFRRDALNQFLMRADPSARPPIPPRLDAHDPRGAQAG